MLADVPARQIVGDLDQYTKISNQDEYPSMRSRPKWSNILVGQRLALAFGLVIDVFLVLAGVACGRISALNRAMATLAARDEFVQRQDIGMKAAGANSSL